MRKMYEMMNNRKGFTLIELIIVIAIIGILAAVIVPRFGGVQDRARQTQAVISAKQLATAIDTFQIEHNAWPVHDDANAITEVLETAGIAAAAGVLTLDAADNGGFTYEIGGHTAGRDSGATAVRVIP